MKPCFSKKPQAVKQRHPVKYAASFGNFVLNKYDYITSLKQFHISSMRFMELCSSDSHCDNEVNESFNSEDRQQ